MKGLEKSLFNSVFTDSSEPLVGLDASGRVVTFSAGAGEMLGLTPDEILSEDFSSCLVDPPLPRLLQLADASTGGLQRFSCRLRRRDGLDTAVYATVRLVKSEGGRDGYLLSLTPATNLAVADASSPTMRDPLLRLERFSLAGQMTSAFAHDIKTPLHVISSTAEYMQEFSALPPEAKEDLETILRNVRHMTSALQALLDFVRVGKLQLRKDDLNAVLRDVFRLLEKNMSKRKVILAESLEPIPLLLIDPNHVRTVAYNLLVNAIEAMPAGGQLQVSTAVIPAENGRGQVEWTVEDSGSGIAPEILARMDDIFFTTKETGMGLGIYLSRKILAQHGAEMRFESPAGKGARVSVHFPVP